MQLCLAPGACSLASYMALQEAGIACERVQVDLRSKRMDNGSDLLNVHAKGDVPALMLDDRTA